MPQWSTHVGNNTVLEDDVVFLHKQEELAVARGLGKKPIAQVCNICLCTFLIVCCALVQVSQDACCEGVYELILFVYLSSGNRCYVLSWLFM